MKTLFSVVLFAGSLCAQQQNTPPGTPGQINKRQDMAGEKDCHKSDATYDVDDTDVRLYPLSAVVTGRVTITRKDKEGKVITRKSHFTDVFVWRDATWQLVAGHSSRIPDAATQK